MSIPEEIKGWGKQIDSLKKAREIIEERFEEARDEKQAEYDEKIAKHEEIRRNGKKTARKRTSGSRRNS